MGLCEESRSLGEVEVESEKGERLEVERLRLNAIVIGDWYREGVDCGM